MLPGLFFQWVRAAVTQQVIAAAQAEVQSELTARAAAAAEGPLPCQVGIVTAEPLESEALEAMLQRPAKFVSEGLTIVQGILALDSPSTSRRANVSATDGSDSDDPSEANGSESTSGSESTESQKVSGIRIAIARAGHGRRAARRAVESLIAGHSPRCVIAAGFGTGLCRQMRAGDLLVASSLILYNPETEAYDSEIPLSQETESEPHSERDAEPLSLESHDLDHAFPRLDHGNSNVQAERGYETDVVGCTDDSCDQVDSAHSKSGKIRKPCKKAHKKKHTAEQSPQLHRGALVTTRSVSRLPKTPKSKRLLAGLSDALVADTESETVVIYCLKRRIPVLVLRGVRESVHETFADEIRHYQKKDSTLGRLGSMLGAFLDREGALTELNRWNRRGHDISQRLAEAIAGIVCVEQPQ